MNKTFITFGQSHIHEVNGKLFDKDTVGVIYSENESQARAIAFEIFDDKFFTTYPETHWKEETMIHFPKGYLDVNDSAEWTA